MFHLIVKTASTAIILTIWMTMTLLTHAERVAFFGSFGVVVTLLTILLPFVWASLMDFKSKEQLGEADTRAMIYEKAWSGYSVIVIPNKIVVDSSAHILRVAKTDKISVYTILDGKVVKFFHQGQDKNNSLPFLEKKMVGGEIFIGLDAKGVPYDEIVDFGLGFTSMWDKVQRDGYIFGTYCFLSISSTLG